MGSHSLLQGVFPTQGSNPGLPHCREILYQLSHQESPRILEWVAYPFSSRSSQPRNQTRVSCIAGKFFTSWATREAQPTMLRESLSRFCQNFSVQKMHWCLHNSMQPKWNSNGCQSLYWIKSKASWLCLSDCTSGHWVPKWTAGKLLIGNRSNYLVRKIDGYESREQCNCMWVWFNI